MKFFFLTSGPGMVRCHCLRRFMMNLLVRVTDTNDMTLTVLKSLSKNKCKVYGNTPGPEVIKLFLCSTQLSTEL